MKFRALSRIVQITLTALAIAQSAYAIKSNEEITRFEYYGTKSGLVQNAVFSMLCDANGFLWLGTTNGLIRFDGIEFKSYNGPSYDSRVCVNERINRMWEDSHNFIWMETYDGELRYFNQRTEKFGTFSDLTFTSRLEDSPTLFLQLNEDTIIIGDRGRGLLFLTYDKKESTYNPRQIATGQHNAAITSLTYDANTGIWLGSDNGIFVININDLKKVDPHLSTIIKGVKATKATIQTKDKIYFGTEKDGVIAIGKRDHRVKSIRPDLTKGGKITILSHIHGRGILAATDNHKLIHINRDSCAHEVEFMGKTLSNINSIYVDRHDQAWICTENYDLTRFDPFSADTHFYKIDIPDTHSLNETEPPCYIEDKDKNLWIGIHGGGLLKFNRKTNKFSQWTNESQSVDDQSIQSNDIFCMAEDKSGNLWLGTSSNTGSVIKVIEKNKAFTTHQPQPALRSDNTANNVRSLTCDKAGNLYIGTKSCSLIAIDNTDNKYYKVKGFRLSDGTLIESMPYTMKVMHDNRLWIGTKGNGILASKVPVSLSVPNIASLTFDKIGKDITKKGVNNIYSLEEEPDGTVWAATFGGGLLRIKTSGDDIEIDTLTSRNTKLTTDKTRFLHLDKNGNLLIATIRGVHIIRKDQLKVEIPSIELFRGSPKEDICHISEDTNGTIFLSSIGNGLTSISPDGKCKTYHKIDGLADNTVYASEQDKHGDTWISTENGISKLTKGNNHIKTYNNNKGLSFNCYSESTVTNKPDGAVIFGGRNGFTIIKPQELNQPAGVEEINITDIWVNGEKIKPATDGFTDESATFTDVIRLDINHNDIVVRFASMDFTDPLSNNYAYRLIGIDCDWRIVGNSNYATYSNLKPGTYRLEICVLDGIGDWAKSKKLDIIVQTPWWERWWAIVFYIIATLTIIALIIHSWIRLYRYKRLVNQLLEINMTATMRNGGSFDIEPTDKSRAPSHQESQSQTQITSKDDELIAEIIKYAETNYKTIIGVDQLAEHFGMSRTTLFNKVKSATGQSPLDFVRQVKLKIAAEMLRKGYSVSEAAYEIGYSDAKYFSKLYRQVFGYNPSEEKRSTNILR